MRHDNGGGGLDREDLHRDKGGWVWGGLSRAGVGGGGTTGGFDARLSPPTSHQGD